MTAFDSIVDNNNDDEEVELECAECGNTYEVSIQLLIAEEYIIISRGRRIHIPQDPDFDDEHCPVCSGNN